MDDVEDTEMSNDTRRWLNNNADWIRTIHKRVEPDSDVDIDTEDMSWEDNW